ncbi:hypothetical protein [Bosea sp. 685]|uniref:hypothetical protein n=1 Tax=Bosea sp. 685 TaxID=3080057 RepID=UPI00289344B9|nr:hypothetical protein [Bosea sp. 685]WNJ89171.1 hypothetical protein RMR04_22535 [Bosea sp. 685]
MKTLTVDLTDDDVIVDETSSSADGAASTNATIGDVVDETEDETSKKAKLPARAHRNEDGSITLPLLGTVTLTIKNAAGTRQETIKELTFHEMTGLDMRLIAQASPDMQTVVALARATRIPSPRMNVLFDKMKGRDVTAAAAVISFLQE